MTPPWNIGMNNMDNNQWHQQNSAIGTDMIKTAVFEKEQKSSEGCQVAEH
jgi:hypothetical protein